MHISNIVTNIEHTCKDESLLKLDVENISADSRSLDGKPTLFFAYRGTNYDTHSDVKNLYDEGKITAAVVEEEIDGVPCILVNNGRKAFAYACANFFKRADRNLTMIAVTGTNGKTTVTWILDRIFNCAGVKTIRVGTTGANVVDAEYILDNTTPSPYEFHKFLAEGVEKGASVAIAEVSSHALDQDRLAGIVFDAAVFTNLSGDHLDYHKDMENYYEAKRSLFDVSKSKIHIINIDDEYGRRMFSEVEGHKYSYGIFEGDICTTEFHMDLEGITAKVSYRGNIYNIKSPLVGRYNLENILAAMATSLALDIPIDVICEGVETTTNIPGRMERYNINGAMVFVDYAHTDDALQNVLSALRSLGEKRLITVFGAGGERDHLKRPRMGKVVSKYSDYAIVTSDNPRSEDPLSIIDEIYEGIEDKDKVIIEPDRKIAIQKAIEMAEPGDIVVIAGKGHEDYQIIGDIRHPFSDGKVVREFISGR